MATTILRSFATTPTAACDTGFGTGGKVTTPIGTDSDYAQDVAVQADGKIIVSGYTKVSLFDTDFALVRYNADGSLDTGFGTGGKVTTAFGTGYDEAYSVTVQADGKIIVAGSANNGSEDFALVRYNADGSLDSGFGTGGKVTTPIGAGTDTAYDVLVQSDGKIVVAGQASGTGYDFALARYNADGSLDTGFGTGGTVLTAVSANNDYGRFVALQSDGKIVVGGDLQPRRFRLRFCPDALQHQRQPGHQFWHRRHYLHADR